VAPAGSTACPSSKIPSLNCPAVPGGVTLAPGLTVVCKASTPVHACTIWQTLTVHATLLSKPFCRSLPLAAEDNGRTTHFQGHVPAQQLLQANCLGRPQEQHLCTQHTMLLSGRHNSQICSTSTTHDRLPALMSNPNQMPPQSALPVPAVDTGLCSPAVTGRQRDLVCCTQAEQPQAGPVVPNAVQYNCSTGGAASRQPRPEQQGGAATKAAARRMHVQPKCTRTSSQVL
jgi:hypothetical protein